MATFQTKANLPKSTQDEIDRIQAIDSGVRTTSDNAFLTAVSPYITNEILQVDGALIVESAGNTLPTGFTGFKKGAEFTKKDATGNGKYLNTGDETSAAWDLVDQASTANIDAGAVTLAKLGVTEKTITIAAGQSTGTATVVAGVKILAWHPETNCDKIVKNISITTTVLTVDLLAAATADTTIKVLVINP